MQKKIIWITGISGVGKTTVAKYIIKKLKNYIWIDGDKFRELFNNDLGYTLKERNINAERLINFTEFLVSQNFNVILSANLTSEKYKKLIKFKFKKKLLHVNIETNLSILRKRDKKNIYRRKKNVVGIDIKTKLTSNFYNVSVLNNSSKNLLFNQINQILKKYKINYRK